MTTSIVLIPVDFMNCRKVCETIERQTFGNVQELRDKVAELLSEPEVDGEVLVYDISDFMDEVNNQMYDVLTEYFISYVYLD